MNEEEIQKVYRKLGLDKHKNYGFNTPKQTLRTYYLIAFFEDRRIRLTRLIDNKKCEIKIITHRGLDTSRLYIHKFYNEELEHENKKIKIIDFEIV